MFAEKLSTLLFSSPMLAFGFDLTHPDSHLRWTEVQNGDGLKTRFADNGHVRLTVPRRPFARLPGVLVTDEAANSAISDV
jgi:hypothetical protein